MKFRLGLSYPFDLNLTLCCGQAFRWDSQDDWWCGVTHGKVVRIKQEGDALEFENVNRDFLMNYFGLDDDLLQVFSQINKDKYVEKAVETCRGLRILRQEPWECLISYICATYKNIASIKRMLLALSTKFGEPTFFKERTYHAFPAPEALAEASLKDLAKCELGYRAKYVLQTAKAVCANDFDFAGLRRLPYEEAKAVLLEFPGVGQKVADCVLLFSLGKYEAFPVDVWIRRVLLRHYAQHFPEEFVQKISQEESLDESQYKRLNLFGRKYFGKYAGYAQEYLYHYERACCGSKPARKPFNREAGSIRFGSCGKRLN